MSRGCTEKWRAKEERTWKSLLWSVAVWGGTLSSTLTLWSLSKRPGISGSALILIMQSKGPTAPAVLGGGSGGGAVNAVGWLL